MASIGRLTVRNYKSLRDITLDMRPLNILIGANGSGKTNLIHFLQLLSNAADERLAETIFSDGGLEAIRWKGAAHQNAISWDVSLTGLPEFNRKVFPPIYASRSPQPPQNPTHKLPRLIDSLQKSARKLSNSGNSSAGRDA